MQLKVGAVTEGKVTGITKFGAFVEIAKGVSGLVHISEISKSFVSDISQVVKCGEIVKVKILSWDNNKLSLSIKQAQSLDQNTPKYNEEKIKTKKSADDINSSFEDMLFKFKKTASMLKGGFSFLFVFYYIKPLLEKS